MARKATVASDATLDVSRICEGAGLSKLVHLPVVASTMDIAHALAADGAAAGTLVLADRQEQGRGRSGNVWISDEDAGIWCTMIERPVDVASIAVLSLRVGMALAAALESFVDAPIQVKWPNDLFVENAKLGGILIEARWRGAQIEWVAIGVGVNRRVPVLDRTTQRPTATLRQDVSRDVQLIQVARAIRMAAACTGPLTAEEMDQWSARDLARGRRVVAPFVGVVHGLSSDGGIEVLTDDGVVRTLHSGSLQFA